MSSAQIEIILRYVKETGKVHASCTQMATVLWDQLKFGTIEICQIMGALETLGKVKYKEGYYFIDEQK